MNEVSVSNSTVGEPGDFDDSVSPYNGTTVTSGGTRSTSMTHDTNDESHTPSGIEPMKKGRGRGRVTEMPLRRSNRNKESNGGESAPMQLEEDQHNRVHPSNITPNIGSEGQQAQERTKEEQEEEAVKSQIQRECLETLPKSKRKKNPRVQGVEGNGSWF
ncbi:hypothetical protein GT037_011158 [Alternaria burnsii]|uniref:Uncharacterized protein n=1 Tax=Alternaria burnsii TaxID=1187904 RepID=A0A8H7B0M6_9PLEO|nr:uncharacterized protein GT037_011158 [Alternaria burnsii]KAF7670707.1 hypothetical protein GT037_011158 [Alternaria burnsii]CAI9635738.1 unnamed protein product [Alternaria burnsii]